MSPYALAAPAAASPSPLPTLRQRVQAEYLEMPGLQLTTAQAARLLGIEPATCEALLDQLTARGFLSRGARGHYVRTDVP